MVKGKWDPYIYAHTINQCDKYEMIFWWHHVVALLLCTGRHTSLRFQMFRHRIKYWNDFDSFISTDVTAWLTEKFRNPQQCTRKNVVRTYAFSWIESIIFRLTVNRNGCPSVQLTLCHVWLIEQFCAEQATNHFINLWYICLLAHICVIRSGWANNSYSYVLEY